MMNEYRVEPHTESQTFRPEGAPQLEITNYTDKAVGAVCVKVLAGAPRYNITIDGKICLLPQNLMSHEAQKTDGVFKETVEFTFFDRPGVASLGGSQGALSAMMQDGQLAVRERDGKDDTWVVVNLSIAEGESHSIMPVEVLMMMMAMGAGE